MNPLLIIHIKSCLNKNNRLEYNPINTPKRFK